MCFVNMELRKVFGPKEEVTVILRRLHNLYLCEDIPHRALYRAPHGSPHSHHSLLVTPVNIA